MFADCFQGGKHFKVFSYHRGGVSMLLHSLFVFLLMKRPDSNSNNSKSTTRAVYIPTDIDFHVFHVTYTENCS